jgi:hypothetical protein
MTQEHPIHPWTLYAHTQANPSNYTESYTKISHMTSIEEWARTWNHCHPDAVGVPGIYITLCGQFIISWSLFRDHIRPTWEDPANSNGVTLTHRTNTNDIDATRVWADLVMECIRGTCPMQLLGIQVTQKTVRSTLFMKFDVWISNPCAVDVIKAWLNSIVDAEFSVAHRIIHDEQKVKRHARY